MAWNQPGVEGTSHLPYTLDRVRAQQHSYRIGCIVRTARRFLSGVDGPEILDVGSGRGEAMRALKLHLNANVTGLDIDRHCVEIAEGLGTGEWGTVQDMARRSDKRFDFVLSSHSLEHMKDPISALDAMLRLSKGPVLVLLPNPHFLKTIVRTAVFGRTSGGNLGHYYMWDAMHLRVLIENHVGAKILEWGTDWVPVVPFGRARKIALSLGFSGFLRLVEHLLLPRLFPFMGESLGAVVTRPIPSHRSSASC